MQAVFGAVHAVHLLRTTCGGMQRAPNACGAAVRSGGRSSSRGFGRPGATGLPLGACRWLDRGGHSDLLLCTHGHDCCKQGCTGNRAQPVAGDATDRHRAKWIVSRHALCLCAFTVHSRRRCCLHVRAFLSDSTELVQQPSVKYSRQIKQSAWQTAKQNYLKVIVWHPLRACCH